MTAFNNTELIGRLTKDIDLRKTTTGKIVTQFTLAVYRDKQHTDFIQCVAWNNTAELLHTYTHKGSLISVHGSIVTRTYDDNSGQRNYITEVNVDSVGFLETKSSSSEPVKQQNSYNNSNDDYFNTGVDVNADDLPF